MSKESDILNLRCFLGFLLKQHGNEILVPEHVADSLKGHELCYYFDMPRGAWVVKLLTPDQKLLVEGSPGSGRFA